MLVGKELRLELETTNRGAQEFSFSAALHTYFAISDIANIQIDGLENTPFLSKVHNLPAICSSRADPHRPKGRPGIPGHESRPARSTILALKRHILIEKEGSRTTVVWNPWAKLAAEMADLGPEAYRGFVCVETVIGPQEEMTLAAGGHRC